MTIVQLGLYSTNKQSVLPFHRREVFHDTSLYIPTGGGFGAVSADA